MLNVVIRLLITLLCSLAITFARSISGKEFQYQCYGTRTLCMYPTEYCSSEIEKCISCSPAVCANKGNIPLSCSSVCDESDHEEEEDEYGTNPLLPGLIVVSVIAALLVVILAVLHIPNLKNKIRSFIPLCGDRKKKNTSYSYVSSSETSVATSSTSTQTDPGSMIQISSAEVLDNQRNCYGEKLKAISPVQDTTGEYHEQVTSNTR